MAGSHPPPRRSPIDAVPSWRRTKRYWREIQQAFTLDRTIINLNNGYTCPSPRVVHEALKRYLDISNQAPDPLHVEPDASRTSRPSGAASRRRSAAIPRSSRITRNASEALQIAQLGIDLQPGDEVVTTDQDYGRMLDTWDQRVRRDKIMVTKISFPVPTTNADELDRSHRRARSRRRRRCIHFCHITNLTGQLFPVQRDLRGWRARAASRRSSTARTPFAHFPFKLSRPRVRLLRLLSLHKWLLAPIGTGFLYVRRENDRASSGRCTPAPRAGTTTSASSRRSGRIRPRTTTRSAEALAVPPGDRHRAQGGAAALPERSLGEAGREAAGREDPQQPRAESGLGAVQRQPRARRRAARPTTSCGRSYRIITAAIKRDDYQGLRVTPNVYTTLGEVDTFASAVEDPDEARTGADAGVGLVLVAGC